MPGGLRGLQNRCGQLCCPGWFDSFPLRHPLTLKGVTGIGFCYSVRTATSRGAPSAQLVPNYGSRIGHWIGKPNSDFLLEKPSAQLVPSYFRRLSATEWGSAFGTSPTTNVRECQCGGCAANKLRCDVLTKTANYLCVSSPPAESNVSASSAPPLMDKKEVAEWLHVCSRTIDNWLLEGWMPVIQLGPRIQRFNPHHILAAIEELFGRGHGYQVPDARKTLNAA